MTATTIHQRRPSLPLLSMLVAGAAATISVIAITTDDVGPRPATAIVTPRSNRQPSPPEMLVAAAGDCLTRALVVRC